MCNMVWEPLLYPLPQKLHLCTLKDSLTVWRFLKKLNREWPYNPAILFLGIYTEALKTRVSNRYPCTHVHSSIVHNGPKAEVTQVATANAWINDMRCIYIKWSIIQPYKECDSDIHYDIGEP